MLVLGLSSRRPADPENANGVVEQWDSADCAADQSVRRDRKRTLDARPDPHDLRLGCRISSGLRP